MKKNSYLILVIVLSLFRVSVINGQIKSGTINQNAIKQASVPKIAQPANHTPLFSTDKTNDLNYFFKDLPSRGHVFQNYNQVLESSKRTHQDIRIIEHLKFIFQEFLDLNHLEGKVFNAVLLHNDTTEVRDTHTGVETDIVAIKAFFLIARNDGRYSGLTSADISLFNPQGSNSYPMIDLLGWHQFGFWYDNFEYAPANNTAPQLITISSGKNRITGKHDYFNDYIKMEKNICIDPFVDNSFLHNQLGSAYINKANSGFENLIGELANNTSSELLLKYQRLSDFIYVHHESLGNIKSGVRYHYCILTEDTISGVQKIYRVMYLVDQNKLIGLDSKVISTSGISPLPEIMKKNKTISTLIKETDRQLMIQNKDNELLINQKMTKEMLIPKIKK